MFTCSYCHYYRIRSPGTEGYCHRYPPQIRVLNEYMDGDEIAAGLLPVTEHDSFCGEWKLREGEG